MSIKHFYLMIMFFGNCAMAKSQTNNALLKALTDTALYKTDTIINEVNIENKIYVAYFVRDKYSHSFKREEDGENKLPITLILFDTREQQIKYWQKFDLPYYNNRIYLTKILNGKHTALNQNGKLLLFTSGDNGMMWFHGKIYYITTKETGNIVCNAICEDDEKQFRLYSKNDNQILVCSGLWENECHWCEHRYKIELVTFNENTFDIKKIGVTKLKYIDLIDIQNQSQPYKKLIYSIKSKEPNLFTKINLAEFTYD